MGPLQFDESTSWYRTEPLRVDALGGECEFTFEEFEEGAEAALAQCIRNFCALDPSVLTAATPALFAYYTSVAEALDYCEDEVPLLTEDEVWANVTFNRTPHVEFHDGRWYVISEDECAWEPEHGLQLVFADGAALTRISSYDGHPTHRGPWPAAEPGVLELPSGRRIRGRSLRRDIADERPDFGVYIGRHATPVEWDHTVLEWPDFRLPRDRNAFAAAVETAWERAGSERVEVACTGGRGRTGVTLACIAIVDGVDPAEAVRFVRENYDPRAVETPWQKTFVAKFRPPRR
ncbi:hypothetical protein [Tsukamurella sp. PLM1]|uniref:protein-tyrosine phosphatase family protein n=1 Tax=Tsukamurella sp. PLM1 TaxID=2929795 RepID=UPI00353005CB